MQLQGTVSLRYFCFHPTRDTSIKNFCAGSPSYSLLDTFGEFEENLISETDNLWQGLRWASFMTKIISGLTGAEKKERRHVC
jgi:hypothetical protein